MKIAIDEDNYFIINPNSCRLINVTLSGKKVLAQLNEGTGSGNFLMYPWVNRVEQNPFPIQSEYKDGNGIPLHGLFVNEKRQIVIKPLSSDSIIMQMVPSLSVQGVPKFKEIYELKRNSLTVRIQTYPNEQVTLPFCFGYHPYLQIQNENLEDLTITTDISKQLKLDTKLLPIYPYEEKQTIVSSSEAYDSLFQGGNYLTITNKQGFNVKISSELPYWQIYTPPDRKRIAVQPMSFTANVYEISAKGFTPSLTAGSFKIEVWQQEQ